MPPLAILFGVLMTALGVTLYVASDFASITALIPAFFGVALIILGFVAGAGGEKVRMHTMHLAALIALVGLVFPAYRVIMALNQGAEFGRALQGQTAMAVLSGIFLALCIKSFIDARRARKARESQETPAG